MCWIESSDSACYGPDSSIAVPFPLLALNLHRLDRQVRLARPDPRTLPTLQLSANWHSLKII